MKTNSALGQRLEIVIPVLADTEELTSLVARIGSMENYQRSGLVYGGFIPDLKAWVDKTPSGDTFVKVVSINPINVPVFDLLIDLSWTMGRTIDSYTVFLDTPEILAARNAFDQFGQSKAVGSDEEVDSLVESEKFEKEDSGNRYDSTDGDSEIETIGGDSATLLDSPEESLSSQPSSDKVERSNVDSEFVAGGFGPITSGDTLSKIALQLKPNDISLEQMLVLLYRKNLAAFIGENMNRLRVGPVLELPTEEDYSSVGHEESRAIVKAQYSQWQEYKEKLVGLAAAGDGGDLSPRQEVTRSVTPASEESQKPDDLPREVLKLSENNSSSNVGDRAPLEQVRQLEEELIAKDNAVREANARMAKLEETIKDLQGLIAVEDENLGALGEEKDGASETEAGDGEIAKQVDSSPHSPHDLASGISFFIFNQNIGQLLDLPAFKNIRDHAVIVSLTEYSVVQKALLLPVYVLILVLLSAVALAALLIIKLLNLKSGNGQGNGAVSKTDKRGSSRKNIEKEGSGSTSTQGANVQKETAYKKNPVGDSELNTSPDLSGIDLDLDGGGDREGTKWYEVQTKFDLAKAYQEMGDRDGALQILMEVMDEGDDDQRAAAKKTISELD